MLSIYDVGCAAFWSPLFVLLGSLDQDGGSVMVDMQPIARSSVQRR